MTFREVSRVESQLIIAVYCSRTRSECRLSLIICFPGSGGGEGRERDRDPIFL